MTASPPPKSRLGLLLVLLVLLVLLIAGGAIWFFLLRDSSEPEPVGLASTQVPVITGSPESAQILTADAGTWTGGATTFAHQWQRCTPECSDIAGAAATTFTATAADVGHTIRVQVTARNAAGASGVALSEQVGPVAAEPPADACREGFTWRLARDIDHVCVEPAVARQVAEDNAAAPGRWVSGAYGPRTCLQGFVWREAYAGDLVCVTPSTRTQAARDNASAADRLRRR